MTDEYFDELLTQALIVSIKRDWIDMPVSPEVEAMDTKRLDKKIAKLSDNPQKYVKDFNRPLYLKVLRSAAAVLLVISVLFGTAMLNADARTWVRQLVRSWYSDHNEYKYSEKYNQTVNRDWIFGYIPEGFELVYEDKDVLGFNYEFSSDTSGILRIAISGGAGTLYMDNEHYEIKSVKIRGDIADAYVSFDPSFSNYLIWPSSEYDVLIIIDADFQIEEMIKIAEQISSE